MKKILFITCVTVLAFVFGHQVSAQVRVNINIGSQPVWGPTGYDYAQYYYMPDIDAYYYIPDRQFVYLEGNRWVFGASLPSRYNYDLYRGYKVVINDPRPYLRPDIYRERYGRYRGWYGRQPVIRDSRDERYYGNDNWRKYNEGNNNDHGDRHGGDHGNGRGHGDEHDNGHGHGEGHDNGHGHGHDHND
ncbi:hypothetical protein CLV51_103492 [Chitinophaga niastensis]|uniref:YXWGXW repeat-containing protein n=1 Tax=Chitinophaga niastensis TaxID=536980 RepID=A0A2P8HJW4_CHINA|nr:hypothetical protein [Chitinophaga niastensis]PSL46512.1 hypothetical protein CLV51_103492 [Chitinophaga niastensis]